MKILHRRENPTWHFLTKYKMAEVTNESDCTTTTETQSIETNDSLNNIEMVKSEEQYKSFEETTQEVKVPPWGSAVETKMDEDKSTATTNGVESSESGTTVGDSSSQENLAQSNTEDEEKKPEEDTELGKYWKTIQDNPMDFTGWTYLLQYVEQENNPDHCRKAYEAFFSHYPYCYGYWKKYSDMEKRNGNKDRAAEVFEKGLRAIPLSVELWLHYLNFFIAENNSGEKEAKDKIRKLYERALAAAGLEFRSDKLWDSYISWENQNSNLKAVTGIYDQLIKTPTQLYSHHWENFCRHINIHHPKDIVDIDTFLKLRTQVLSKGFVYEDNDDEPGLDEALQMGESTDVDAPPGVLSLMGDEKEVKKIRLKLIEMKETAYEANVAEIGTRWTFEETIRRPYFHVKPLERGQLKNWREYLDFEIAQKNHNRIVVLFERSLIACALYEDFWMKYAKYLEQHSIDGVRSVYQRACDIHLPKKPYIHLSWAAFEERKENISLARKILMNIESNVPGLAMVCMRRISLERRSHNHEAAEELFKKYIETAVSHKSRTFFCIKYARYLQKVMGEADSARKVLNDALEIDNTNEKVFLQLLDVEYQSQPIVEDRVMETFNRLLSSDVSLEFKVKVSQRRMEFLEDFGACIKKISYAYDEHQKIVKEANTKKKRPEREQIPEEPPDKRLKPDAPVIHNPPALVEAGPTVPPLPPIGPPPPPDVAYAYQAAWGQGYSVPSSYSGYPYQSYPSQYGYYGF